jgi:hypothetical protein
MQTNAIEKATTEIEQVLKDCDAIALAELPALTRAVTLSTGIEKLRRVLTIDVVKQVFEPLMGSALGFKTDKDKEEKKYPLTVVRDCIIEGLIAGLQPVNNEINIIAGNMYAAKNGMARKVREFPGLTDLHIDLGVPHLAGDKGALVVVNAQWKLSGKPMSLVRDITRIKDETGERTVDYRLPVRVNSGMGPDAILGKAHRKVLKAIYDSLTGSTLTFEDGEAIEAEGQLVSEETAPAPAAPEQDGKRISLKGKRQSEPPPAAETPQASACASEWSKAAEGPPPMPEDLPPSDTNGTI